MAVITKTHHAMVDGVSAVDIGTVILDLTAVPREVPEDDWRPRKEPGAASLVVGAFTDLVKRPTQAVDTARASLVDARATVGAVLNRIDSESERLETQKLASRTERSNAEDVDLVHAISDFQQKQTGYDAALKSYAMVQRLSLFQYVNGN